MLPHVLRTYSTCSYPGYQDTTTYAALVNRIPSEMEVAPRYKLLTLLTLLTLIRSLRPIVRQLVNGFFLNCINYIGQAEGTLHRVGNASFWPCHHRAMHKSNTPFLQKYTNRSCAKV